ncbi:hypothetical protein FL863_13920 [Listeria monocytogenes]|nr:hypothetical protein [Listeria monocytogenes]
MSEQEAKKIILKWLKESSEFLTPIRLFFDLENRNSKAPRQVVEAYLAIEYYKDNVIPLIQKKIEANGLDKFRKEVEKAKKYMVETHGERPEIKDIEGESK